MNIRKWFKPKLNISDINLEELKRYPEMNQKLIFHYFKILFYKLKDETYRELENRVNKISEEIIGFITGVGISDLIETKNINVEYVSEGENAFSLIIKFADKSNKQIKKSMKNGSYIENINPKDTKSYFFSPYQSLMVTKIFPKIEHLLVSIFKIKLHEEMHQYTFGKGGIIVNDFDGTQFMTYYLEKRIKFYKKFPKIDYLLFGMELKDFLKWILEKRNHDKHMNKYCYEVDKLIKKHKIELK